MRRWIAIIATALQLCACGGGHGGPTGTMPPTGLSYPAPMAFTVGTAIAPLTPTVSGAVTSYSVIPALPAGLALDTTSGVISGTPTAVAAKANYTVTASNSGGSVNATVTLQVNAGAPVIGYPSLSYTFTVNQVANITPTSSVGVLDPGPSVRPFPKASRLMLPRAASRVRRRLRPFPQSMS